MDLALMRTTFQRHTSGLADDMDDAEVDAYLTSIYAEFLPADIDGKVHETRWEVTLAVGTNPVTIPNRIMSFPTGRFYLQGTGGNMTGTPLPLNYYDKLDAFFAFYPEYRSSATTGQPMAVLRQGKSLYLSCFPNDDYNLIADARGAQAAAITTDGLPFNHAMTVVTAAAWQFLLEQEDEAAVVREAAQYETFKGRLLMETHGDYVGHTPSRSF